MSPGDLTPEPFVVRAFFIGRAHENERYPIALDQGFNWNQPAQPVAGADPAFLVNGEA